MMNLDKLLPIFEKLLPVFCVILGWVLNDYLTRRKEEVKNYRVATFHVLQMYKSVMDYERGTRFFRQERPTVDKFEPWRAILEAKCCQSFEVNADATSKTVETLASVDPPLAARLDNTIKNMLFTFKKDMPSLATNDHERYAKLVYNLDQLVEMTLKDFETVALKLASRGGFGQKANVSRWFAERESGTKDFMDSMREQEDLLRKVVQP
jgi:hypothetical protein